MNKESKSNKEMTIDDLAIMVQSGFLSLEERIDKKLDSLKIELKKEISEAKEELKNEIKDTKNELKTELNKKVDIFTHKDLEYRVEKVEEKSAMLVRDKE